VNARRLSGDDAPMRGALAYALRIESSQQGRDLVVRFAGRFAFTVGWQILGRR
jgi:hypothetical protein